MSIDDKVVQRVLQAIEESGYSQREFARKFGIAENLISRWNTGNRKPSIASIRKVANGSKKNLNWFLVGDSISNIGDNSVVGKNQNIGADQKEIAFLKKEVKLLRQENAFLREQLKARKAAKK